MQQESKQEIRMLSFLAFILIY